MLEKGTGKGPGNVTGQGQTHGHMDTWAQGRTDGGVLGAVWLLHTAGVFGWSRNLGNAFQCSHRGRCVLHKHGATCQGWERPKTPPVPPPCPRDSLMGRSRSSCGGLSEGFFKHKKSGLENKSSSPSPPCPHPTSPRRCTRPQSAEKARTC